MKLWIISIGLAELLLVATAMAEPPASGEHALEPCINGAVSATGLFATQAEEDGYFAALQARTKAKEIKAEVSLSGGFTAVDE
jgi:hypothetical protein